MKIFLQHCIDLKFFEIVSFFIFQNMIYEILWLRNNIIVTSQKKKWFHFFLFQVTWIAYKGNCYYFMLSSRTASLTSWYGADFQCRKMGGYLASIHSQEESDFIMRKTRGQRQNSYLSFNV